MAMNKYQKALNTIVDAIENEKKGYFKGVDENARIEDILGNCEVI